MSVGAIVVLGVVGLMVLLIVFGIIAAWRYNRTPEGRMQAAQEEAERQEAIASLSPGWSVSDPDRERYGVGKDGIDAWATLATGPGGQKVVGVALSKAGAYDVVIRGVRGEIPEADAWAPRILAASFEDQTPHNTERRPELPAGWTWQSVDYENYRTGGESLPTYGALAADAGHCAQRRSGSRTSHRPHRGPPARDRRLGLPPLIRR